MLNRREEPLSLDLLSVPLLIQPSLQLTFAMWAHCWLMFSLVSTRSSRSFSSKQVSSQLPPDRPDAWDEAIQARDFAFAFVELHEVSARPCLQPVKVPLNSTSALGTFLVALTFLPGRELEMTFQLA